MKQWLQQHVIFGCSTIVAFKTKNIKSIVYCDQYYICSEVISLSTIISYITVKDITMK